MIHLNRFDVFGRDKACLVPTKYGGALGRKMKSLLNWRLYLSCEKFINSKINIPHGTIHRT